MQMSNVVNLATGSKKTLLKMSLVSSRDAVGGANVAGKGDAISSNGDARSVGITLLWADLANHFGVSHFYSAFGWDIFKADEEEGVGSLDSLACAVGVGANTLAEAAEFFGL